MADFKDRAVEVYRDIAQLPYIDGARIFCYNSLLQVEVNWKQKDIDRGKNIGYAKTYLVNNTTDSRPLHVTCELNFQRDTTAVLSESYSSNGKVRAVLLKDKSSKDEKYTEPHQYIEVWHSDMLVKSFSVKNDLKKFHGKIHVDNDQFSSFQLCSDGSKLLYVAEKKKPESVSYFKKSSDDSDQKKPVEEGTENVYQESWGEQLTDVINPVVVALTISTGECTVFNVEDKDLSLGKAQWRPDSNQELVFVGYNNQPQKLGYIYCVNRESYLYYGETADAKCSLLYGGAVDLSSPRFNPQGTKLVFLEFSAVLPSPHLSCAKLKMMDCSSKVISTVIEQVARPLDDGFTGIYSISFPYRCWNQSGDKVYFSDICKASIQITCVDVNASKACYLTSSLPDQGTYSLYDVFNDLMVFSYSCPGHPPSVFVSPLPPNNTLSENNLCKITQVEYSYKDQVKWEFVNPSCLEVWPHGGPHGSLTASFISWMECLTVLGFSVLMVNYRGSVGFGQDFVTALPGNVGVMDVGDVQSIAEEVVNGGKVDGSRVAVTGGSHGGFLSAHLVGQHPDFYKAAFIRNPVINMAIMSSSTDIPDWCYYEAGLPYDSAGIPTAEQYSVMLKKSPITHADKIKASVIVALGGEDRRCPPSQGKELYFTLKALGKDVSLYWYPDDCHPLMSVDTTGDCFMHLALHFNKHCMTN